MYVDVRAAQSDDKFRYAPSVGTFELTSDTLKQELLEGLGITDSPDSATLYLSHRFLDTATANGARIWRNTILQLVFTDSLLLGSGYDAHLRYYKDDAISP